MCRKIWHLSRWIIRGDLVLVCPPSLRGPSVACDDQHIACHLPRQLQRIKPVSETGSVQQLFCVTWTLQASLSLRNQLPKSSSRLRACLQCRPLHHKSVAVAMLDLGLGVSSSKLSQAGFTAYGVVSCRSSRCRLIMTKARLCCTPSVRMDALALPCQEQFLDLGCPNCRDSLGMQDSGSSFHIAVLASLFQENEARVLACTTASFAGFFSLVRPAVNSG